MSGKKSKPGDPRDPLDWTGEIIDYNGIQARQEKTQEIIRGKAENRDRTLGLFFLGQGDT